MTDEGVSVTTQVSGRLLEVLESDGSDEEKTVRQGGGGAPQVLFQSGDQEDHNWIAVGDDDFRHRRRGRPARRRASHRPAPIESCCFARSAPAARSAIRSPRVWTTPT